MFVLTLSAGHQHLITHLGELFCHALGGFPGLEGSDPDPVIGLNRCLHRGHMDILKPLA